MIRNILAVLVGIAVGGLTVGGVEMLGHRLFPPPEGLDPSNPESITAAIEQMPWVALLFVPLAWFVGTLVGTALAANLASSHRIRCAYVVGGLMLLGGVTTLLRIPHPYWLTLLGVFVFFPSTWIGARLSAN